MLNSSITLHLKAVNVWKQKGLSIFLSMFRTETLISALSLNSSPVYVCATIDIKVNINYLQLDISFLKTNNVNHRSFKNFVLLKIYCVLFLNSYKLHLKDTIYDSHSALKHTEGQKMFSIAAGMIQQLKHSHSLLFFFSPHSL